MFDQDRAAESEGEGAEETEREQKKQGSEEGGLRLGLRVIKCFRSKFDNMGFEPRSF